MSQKLDPGVILITGASSGIGRSCAQHLSQKGYIVYGTSRSPGQNSTGYQMISLNVDHPDAVANAVMQVLSQEGHIDVLINNAGYGVAGSVEDTSMSEMKQQFETNYFGMVRMIHQVLPSMRARRQGCIINISSIGGRIGIPFQGAYSASKFAVEGLTEVLSMELKAFGIRVVLVEPGDFRTSFTEHRIKAVRSLSSPVYADRCQGAVQVMERDERQGHDPIEIASLVEKIIQNPSPGLRYSVGPPLERCAIH
ncbi:MAG: SDR family oxidoreductase, partial [Candidatus Marinimicrobia bacterium]|nr:SDR family oxidoreductase [Candidatus Neomarinimicrobiota bacterium]